jgi:hypothetical protein
MAWITPGIQKHSVRIQLNINAPIRPVVKTAAGGNRMQRKYLIIILRALGFY